MGLRHREWVSRALGAERNARVPPAQTPLYLTEIKWSQFRRIPLPRFVSRWPSPLLRRRIGLPGRVALMLLVLNIPCHAVSRKSEKHLFILSGQSNMTGGLQSGFTECVQEHFGDENVAIVFHCKSGRGIRFWDRDYQFPENYRIPGKGAPSERSRQQHGQEYEPLIEKSLNACKGNHFETVTFIWMQGESDGARGLGEVYEQSFLRVMARMKKDFAREDFNFVIGRISDARSDAISAESWRRVRQVQVKIAEEAQWGEWINTDDLNGPKDDLHYPAENQADLGRRFAEQAIKLISRRNSNGS